MKIETCCQCKMQFGMEDHFYQTMLALKEGGKFFCPAGHSQWYVTGESDLTKMRRRAERAEQDQAYWQDRSRENFKLVEEEKRKTAAARGQVTKIKNRIGHGVCPCCNRSFTDLARHMASKHSDYAKDAV